MLVHAVIFASFETHADSDRPINLPSPEQDPRMGAFINYALKNFAAQRKKFLDVQIDGLEKEIESRKRDLKELERIVNRVKSGVNHVE